MVSRHTKLRIGWFLSVVVFVQQLAMYLVGKRYAAAVEAGEKPSKDEVDAQMERWAEQSDQACSGQQCSVSTDVDSASGKPTAEKTQEGDADAVDRPGWKQIMAADWAEQYGDKRIAPRWVAVGFVRGVSYQLARDYDVFGLRTNRHRQLLWTLSSTTIKKHVVGEGQFSEMLGGIFGTISYRTVYGLLREPPGNK